MSLGLNVRGDNWSGGGIDVVAELEDFFDESI